jgi:hypothetical protein
MIVMASFLDDAEIFCVGESEDSHRSGIFKQKLVVNLYDLVGLKVDHIDGLVGHIQDYHFFFSRHPEEIDDIVEFELP